MPIGMPAGGYRVSPGLMPRPSLSVVDVEPLDELERRVAGVDAPAFVERLD